MPVICQVVGYKNSGKTTLVCALVESLKKDGFEVAVIKHDAHDFDMDHPGTDSYRHRSSGAGGVALVSSRRTAVIEEKETKLKDLVERFRDYDVILVEGFKHEHYPKIVMIRQAEDSELIHQLRAVQAVVSWLPVEEMAGFAADKGERIPDRIVVFDKDDIHSIAEWLKKLNSE